MAGLACYQKGKLARLEAWLDGRSVSESWAYSDSINDRFYLNMQRMQLQSTLMIALKTGSRTQLGNSGLVDLIDYSCIILISSCMALD